MNAWQIKNGLRALILLITRAHPMGFRVLLGECSPPDSEEIHNMLSALRDDIDPEMRVDGGGQGVPEAIRLLESEEKFNVVVECAGGWEHINNVCTEWARHYSPTWKILIEHSQWATNGFTRIDDSQIQKIANDNGVSRDTVWRRVREFPGELARAILIQPVSKSESIEWDLERQIA